MVLYLGSNFLFWLSLDFETDEKMREVIQTELAGATVLAVAHRICQSSCPSVVSLSIDTCP